MEGTLSPIRFTPPKLLVKQVALQESQTHCRLVGIQHTSTHIRIPYFTFKRLVALKRLTRCNYVSRRITNNTIMFTHSMFDITWVKCELKMRLPEQVIRPVINQSINQFLFAQNVQRYTKKAFQLRAGQQG